MVKIISGHELLLMTLAEIPVILNSRMPKIIHQSWKTSDVPKLYSNLRTSWLETYPDWLHVLWTDADNAELVRTRYPQHLELYKIFPREIYRADFVRNLYMHAFGGMYVDLDFDSFRSLEQLFQEELVAHSSCLFLGRMAEPKAEDSKRVQESLCNAFMASTPEHDFWPTVISQVNHAWQEDGLTIDGKQRRQQVVHITGPVVLFEAYNKWMSTIQQTPSMDYIRILPHTYVYPFAWYPTVEDVDNQPRPSVICQDGKEFNLEAARALFNNGIAYACTYWGSSWRIDWLDDK